MKRPFLLLAIATATLLFGLVVVTGRLIRLAGPTLTWDAGGRHPATLPADLEQLLRNLDGTLSATLFISDRSRMPSNLQDVESTTRALLQKMAGAAGGHFSYRVIDPDHSGAAGAHYAAARRVSPIRVRRVIDDAESQAEIWSSLVFARQGQPSRNDILIQGIENAHLPHLGALVAAHLQAARFQASFALSAPPGFDELPRYLSQHGPVIEIDVDRSASIPHDVDVLFWLEPRNVTARHIGELRRFLATGRTVVLAGSPYHIRYTATDTVVRFHAESSGNAWERLLEPFGLRPLPDLVMDRNNARAPVIVDGQRREVDAPFHLRNLPAFRDFRPFRSPARGGLSFIAPGPLQIDPQRVASAGYQAHVAATTTERAWVRHMPVGEFGLADLTTDLIAPKQNLMVLLTPQDPWAGRLLVLASASCFRNDILTQKGFGHTVFLTDLARTFTHPEQLIRHRVERYQPPPLPALSDAQRIGWRLVAVALIPLFWLVAAGRRLAPDAGLRWRRSGGRVRRHWIGIAAPVCALALWFVVRGPLAGIRIDTTATDLHTPSPQVIDELRQTAGTLQAQLVLSSPSQLPADIRAVAGRMADLLKAGHVPLEVISVDVDDTPPQDLTPFEVERVRRDTSVTTRIYSALRLRRGGRTTVIPRLDSQTGRHLDFLVAAALRRLDHGPPVVTVVSDLPRLSPAEALEDYQKKGLSAPQGVDVYSRAKAILGEYGYQVRHVSPRDPVLPQGADAVLWFQPRRNSTPVLTQLSRHLGDGGRAIVAMQHFNIQQRQYRGTGFEIVHWPQPQFQDFDRYLRLVGVEQMREVLFDRTQHHLEVDTQVNRTAVREYDAQQVALPFLIRAVSANFSSASPLTRNLGDLLFIWGNRFQFDLEGMRAADITAQVLVTTTKDAWAYDWSGGWLPAVVFDEAANTHLPGPQALAVTLEGKFPVVEAVRTEDAGTELIPNESVGGEHGWLLLIGSSEMFKDSHLLKPGFAHEQLLLNAVAHAVHGPQLAALQGRHASAAYGFAVADTTTRSTWRVAVIGGGPFLLGLVALWRQRRVRARRGSIG